MQVGDPSMIVGLGNPGPRYEGTRHNLGFRIVGRLAGKLDGLREARSPRAKAWEGHIGGTPIVLLLPRTYMNLSGGAVQGASDRYGVVPSRVLVVCDDLNLPLAKIRLRRGGSAGGHKGLQSVIEALRTESFPRLRVGIGDPGEQDAEEYVLEPFTVDEEEAIDAVLDPAAGAAGAWVIEGIEEAMSRYNG